MAAIETLANGLIENWALWFISIVLIVAAVIDGVLLKVPNWLTYPVIFAGWIYAGIAFGWAGLGYSMLGTFVGLGLLLPAYAIGGMGSGDVKLLAGVGAWMFVMLEQAALELSTPFAMLWAFGISTVIGALMSVAMVLISGKWRKHYLQFFYILHEIRTVKNPEKLAAIAAERKSTMMLLPYGIPIAIGTVLYFAWMGMLI